MGNKWGLENYKILAIFLGKTSFELWLVGEQRNPI
jgi:hypothetical protein